MKTNNITISIPYKGCDKNCEYCSSKLIKEAIIPNDNLFLQNLNKIVFLSKKSEDITSILITSRGEPLLNKDILFVVLEKFKNCITKIQTNGKILYDDFLSNKSIIEKLYKLRLNIISFSIDTILDIEKYSEMFKYLSDKFVLRISLIITKKLNDNLKLKDWLKICKGNYIKQLSFRNINILENIENNETVNWIIENQNKEYYSLLKEEVKDNYKIIREVDLIKIYDCDNISIALFDKTVINNNSYNDIHDLIYLEDGHLYTSWLSKSSILF